MRTSDSWICVARVCGSHRQSVHVAGQRARFHAQRNHRFVLRGVTRFPLRCLRRGLRDFRRDLPTAPGKLFGALAIEGNAVLAAIDFQRREVQMILVLANCRVEFVDALVQQILLAFLRLNGLRVLRFGGGEFFEALGDAFGFGIQFARLTGEHLADDAAHLVANFGIASRLGRLALQRAELLFDFDDDVVDARKIDLRRFELRFRQALLGLELGDARGFFDDRAALVRLGRKDQPDAALLDDGVGIRTQADAHEHFLNVAQPRRRGR